MLEDYKDKGGGSRLASSASVANMTQINIRSGQSLDAVVLEAVAFGMLI